jgi:hypothetical protein
MHTIFERYFPEDQSRPVLAERFTRASPKTTSGSTFNLGEKTWEQRCRYFDGIFNQHSLAKSQTLTIAGQIISNDIYLEARQREGESYPRADEAKAKCEDLNKDLGFSQLILETAVNLVKYGSCFWEKTHTPTFNVRMMPRIEQLAPYHQNPIGDIDVWRLPPTTGNYTALDFHVPDEIVEFHWNRTTASWPYGTSLYVGLDTEFSTLAQLELDIQQHMHTTAHPKEVIGVGDKDYRPNSTDVSTIRAQFRQWSPGETVVTNYPINGVQMGVMDREIGDLATVLDFVKDQATDGLMMPPISRQYNSTNASSQEMTDWAQANLIIPMRRLIGYVVERQVYRDYLMSEGYSVRVTPSVLWEPADMNREEDAEYYFKMVTAEIIPPRMAAEELGLDMDEWDKWAAERKAEKEEQFNQQQQQQEEGGRQWKVEELLVPSKHSH